jgi:hypothetical protein
MAQAKIKTDEINTMKTKVTRQKLGTLVGKGTVACTATITARGKVTGINYGIQDFKSDERCLLHDLTVGGIHLYYTWVDCPEMLHLIGKRVTFTATVHHYQKQNGDVSFGLRDMTNIKVIT